ncbi:hypothetical protein ElyMa_004416300 [Elysia marginata]|uniref:Uncharacterized protein n=1 Tax=Elysia marginata TaxID=1093978 RepID=A0AAV4HBK2_9GAST|nr:hypothetical protein ElyMa_004416300 [Elysia marginata]
MSVHWLSVARILLGVGGITNLLSFVLQALVFWPSVLLMGQALNMVLQICRVLDFFGAPTKFIGTFIFFWYIPDVNYSYSWYTHDDDLLQLDPLPLGLILFSYILQTLSFVGNTLATDKGARGQDTHIQLIKQQKLQDSLEVRNSHPAYQTTKVTGQSRGQSRGKELTSNNKSSRQCRGKELTPSLSKNKSYRTV